MWKVATFHFSALLPLISPISGAVRLQLPLLKGARWRSRSIRLSSLPRLMPTKSTGAIKVPMIRSSSWTKDTTSKLLKYFPFHCKSSLPFVCLPTVSACLSAPKPWANMSARTSRTNINSKKVRHYHISWMLKYGSIISGLLLTDTSEEREVMLNAVRQCESIFSRFYLNEALEDVRFDFQLRDDIVIGSPFRYI